MRQKADDDPELQRLKQVSELSALRMRIAAQCLRDRLRFELRYNPDVEAEPRLPLGQTGGGQWMRGGEGNGRSRRVAEMGERILSWKEPGLISRGVYEFQNFMVVVNGGQRILPPSLTSASPLIQSGQLVNDNRKR